jgi:uncharacterized protein
VFHVLRLTYLQPVEVVDLTRPAHLDWLKAAIDDGRLILAGRLDDQSGAVLITGDIEVDEAENLMATDPYQQAGLVRYERTGFNAGFRAPGL